MWKYDDKNLTLHGSGSTIKYKKSSSSAIAKHKKKLHAYMNYTIVLRLNYKTPISMGIVINFQYIELISIGGRKMLTFTIAGNNVNIMYGNVLMSVYKIENDNVFNLAICFSSHTNSITIMEETIASYDQNNVPVEHTYDQNNVPVEHTHETIHENMLSQSEDDLKPSDKIVVVNYEKDKLILPPLSKNKMLTIIKSYKSLVNTNERLIITTVPPCTINDKESVSVRYNNSINLCGIEKLNKWFII